MGGDRGGILNWVTKGDLGTKTWERLRCIWIANIQVSNIEMHYLAIDEVEAHKSHHEQFLISTRYVNNQLGFSVLLELVVSMGDSYKLGHIRAY